MDALLLPSSGTLAPFILTLKLPPWSLAQVNYLLAASGLLIKMKRRELQYKARKRRAAEAKKGE